MTRLLCTLLGAASLIVGCGGATPTPLPGGPPPEYEPPRPYDAGSTNVDELGGEAPTGPSDEFGDDSAPGVPPPLPPTAAPTRELLPPPTPPPAPPGEDSTE